MKRIGCFHAHYSNIEPIDRALGAYDVELIHFVDPGLDRIKNDAGFTAETAEAKVLETLDWIAKCHVDAMLVTCTFFTAIIDEDAHRFPVPVIKIDDPLFREIAASNQPTVLVFTNPATVEGTMRQLGRFLATEGKTPRVESYLLPGTFELIMQGRKETYLDEVYAGLQQVVQDRPGANVAAAQLSMVPAARQASLTAGIAIGNPLALLTDYCEQRLSLKRKSEDASLST